MTTRGRFVTEILRDDRCANRVCVCCRLFGFVYAFLAPQEVLFDTRQFSFLGRHAQEVAFQVVIVDT